MSATVAIAFSTFFTVSALVLVALSFSTDYWVDNYIQRDVMVTPPPGAQSSDLIRIYFDRHYGLFRECYDSNSSFLSDPYFKNSIIDRTCLVVEYEIPEKPNHKAYSDQYWTMIHIMRCVVAFFIVSMLFLLSGAIFGAVSCWTSGYKSARVAGSLVFVGGIFVALAMSFFHGADYIQREKLSTIDPTDPGFYQKLWPPDVVQATIRRYSWSFILGWIGCGIAFVAAILYLCTSWYIKDREREKDIHEKYSVKAMRTMPAAYAYDIVDASTPVYRAPDDYLYVVNGSKPMYATRGYTGPYAYEEQSLKVTPPEPWEYRY